MFTSARPEWVLYSDLEHDLVRDLLCDRERDLLYDLERDLEHDFIEIYRDKGCLAREGRPIILHGLIDAVRRTNRA